MIYTSVTHSSYTCFRLISFHFIRSLDIKLSAKPLKLIDLKKMTSSSIDGIRPWAELSVEIVSDFEGCSIATIENSRCV